MPDEVKEKLSMAPYWSADKWIDVLSKRWWTEEKVSILFEYKLSRKNSSTFEPFKVIQEKLILEMLVSIPVPKARGDVFHGSPFISVNGFLSQR